MKPDASVTVILQLIELIKHLAVPHENLAKRVAECERRLDEIEAQRPNIAAKCRGQSRDVGVSELVAGISRA